MTKKSNSLSKATVEGFVKRLHDQISSESKILTEGDPAFHTALERWTDIDRKAPAVVVQPINESDIAKTVSLIFPCLYTALFIR